MLRKTKDLEKYVIKATDGEIGHVKDFYFDDDTWVVRYLVVDTGAWLSHKKVLISPISIHKPNWIAKTLPASITKEQVSTSPDIDTEEPVSRQHELMYLGHYGYNNYWGGAGLWGGAMYPYSMGSAYTGYGANQVMREHEIEAYQLAMSDRRKNDDPHLRSCNAVIGYHLHAKDGEIGRVVGYLLDDRTWAIRYLVVNTSNWWMGHEVLVATDWVTDVRWSDNTVSVDLSRDAIKYAPIYNPTLDWSHEMEKRLYQHYGHDEYWASKAAPETET